MNRTLFCTIMLAFLLALEASAQPNVDTASASFQVNLNLSSPGARSLALGGAFVGLADDATAAFANPAGLTNLSRPEISAEARHWKYTTIYPNSGHAFGPVSGQGVDTVPDIQTGEASNSLTGLSFLSFTYPYKRGAFAFYRHELVNFEANFATQGLFFDVFAPNRNSFVTLRLLPSKINYDLNIVTYGLSGAFRINDRLSAGATLTYYDFSLRSTTTRFLVPNQPPGFYQAPDFATISNILTENGDDNDFGGNFGLLWKVTNNWSLGTVYRKGAKFSTTLTNLGRPDEAGELKVPDAIAIGTAFKPTDQLTVTTDVTHIKYSDTFKTEDRVKIDDADEVHFGVEYVVLRQPSHPVSLRLGAWLDPDHQPSFRGLPDDLVDQRRLAVLFLRGKDEWHYSGGIGFVLGEKFQLDAAADFSKRDDIFSLSSVYRF